MEEEDSRDRARAKAAERKKTEVSIFIFALLVVVKNYALLCFIGRGIIFKSKFILFYYKLYSTAWYFKKYWESTKKVAGSKNHH